MALRDGGVNCHDVAAMKTVYVQSKEGHYRLVHKHGLVGPFATRCRSIIYDNRGGNLKLESLARYRTFTSWTLAHVFAECHDPMVITMLLKYVERTIKIFQACLKGFAGGFDGASSSVPNILA